MRTEEDSFGKVKVPSDAYYGPFTQRAMDNFPISGVSFPKSFIIAYAILKRSAALANAKLGSLDPKVAKAIAKACDEIIKGKYAEQFPIDVFQAGAGTSTNMNLNEVIANRALELMGHKKGNYKLVNPNDHVNMSQSTNDTFQSAVHIAAYMMIDERLLPALARYQNAIEKKSKEFSKVIKSGRTHLMDAVPITLGQEFSGYSIEQAVRQIKSTSHDLLSLNIGGTAVGTGLNTYPKYRALFLKELNLQMGYYFTPAKNTFAMTQNLTTIAEVSSSLKELSLKLIKMANDIRLMSSGPYTGLGEITIPEVQPGSSIMPGKINPSMAEMLTMVCFKVIGNDSSITMAAQAGQFELNVFGPLAAYDLLESIEILANGVDIFTKRCIVSIKPNKDRLNYYFEHSPAVATALSPILGYAKTAELVKEAVKKNISIRNLVLQKKLLTKKQLDDALNPSKLTKPNLPLKK
jgi:aspartate ammonia-lyase